MPRWLTQFRLRLRSLIRKGRVDRELDEELQYHLERKVEHGVVEGLGPQEARYAALRAMGAITQSKEECRDMRGLNWIENIVKDTLYAVRGLRRSPVFSLVVILSLALGIGANTAVYSVMYAVLLRSLPVNDPEHLVQTRDLEDRTHCFLHAGDGKQPSVFLHTLHPFDQHRQTRTIDVTHLGQIDDQLYRLLFDHLR